MQQEAQFDLWGLLPLVIMSVGIGVAAYFLAKDKERNVVRWTVLGCIPVVNIVAVWFFIGASNLRVERKLDEVLQRLAKAT